LGTDTLRQVEIIKGASGKANTINGATATAGTATLNVNLSTNSLQVNNIPVLGTLNFTVQNFVNVTGTTNGDTIRGNSLNNTLNGNSGNDLLEGGSGNDTLTGGSGADNFRFNSASERTDRITDYTYQQGDKIQLDDFGFGGGLTVGALLFSQFNIGSSAFDSSDRVIYNSTNGALFFDVDGTGSNAQVQIATLTTNLPLISSDFTVV
jgi:Ca2+-binding RTX toxin-like protein